MNYVRLCECCVFLYYHAYVSVLMTIRWYSNVMMSFGACDKCRYTNKQTDKSGKSKLKNQLGEHFARARLVKM